ncbi:hypothetical protein HUX88_11970 [Duganella sp. BJB1802]|uniref:hypothetical protein n=1 Tax=Duganella sp. BJB1802 TaxID=2744575 RepID=UPI001594988A|nr:hypothetical protein [Duganella sp. BJB1802]NVD71268.1 hypothetical protein [Duganella sp. BJB1802]
MKVLSLKCENCGATLDVGHAVSTVVCGYCRGEQLVERGEEDVSLREQQEMLDDASANLIMRRMASEQAIERFESDIREICEERDNNIRVFQGAQSKKGCLGLSFLLVGIAVTLVLLDEYSIPLWFAIPFGFFLLALTGVFAGPKKETEKTIEASAAAKMAPLKEQIARHQAIIDSCDYGTAS